MRATGWLTESAYDVQYEGKYYDAKTQCYISLRESMHKMLASTRVAKHHGAAESKKHDEAMPAPVVTHVVSENSVESECLLIRAAYGCDAKIAILQFTDVESVLNGFRSWPFIPPDEVLGMRSTLYSSLLTSAAQLDFYIANRAKKERSITTDAILISPMVDIFQVDDRLLRAEEVVQNVTVLTCASPMTLSSSIVITSGITDVLFKRQAKMLRLATTELGCTHVILSRSGSEFGFEQSVIAQGWSEALRRMTASSSLALIVCAVGSSLNIDVWRKVFDSSSATATAAHPSPDSRSTSSSSSSHVSFSAAVASSRPTPPCAVVVAAVAPSSTGHSTSASSEEEAVSCACTLMEWGWQNVGCWTYMEATSEHPPYYQPAMCERKEYEYPEEQTKTSYTTLEQVTKSAAVAKCPPYSYESVVALHLGILAKSIKRHQDIYVLVYASPLFPTRSDHIDLLLDAAEWLKAHEYHVGAMVMLPLSVSLVVPTTKLRVSKHLLSVETRSLMCQLAIDDFYCSHDAAIPLVVFPPSSGTTTVQDAMKAMEKKWYAAAAPPSSTSSSSSSSQSGSIVVPSGSESGSGQLVMVDIRRHFGKRLRTAKHVPNRATMAFLDDNKKEGESMRTAASGQLVVAGISPIKMRKTVSSADIQTALMMSKNRVAAVAKFVRDGVLCKAVADMLLLHNK
jgi:uncharacterized protein (TIGR02452 family)